MQHQTKLIGLVGKKGAGKSTAAGAFNNAAFVPFALPIKTMLERFGVPYGCLFGDAKEEPLEMLCGKSARYAMQTLGTQWGRDMMGDSFWLDAWWRWAKPYIVAQSYDYLVVDDVRFLNEAAYLKARGATLIRISRMIETTDQHQSEIEQDQIVVDYDLPNSGTQDDLRKMMTAIITG